MILKPCLNCKSAEIRAAVCGLIAELCQNNPYCQKVIIDHEFVPVLVNILNKDEENQVGIKCIYALSGKCECILRVLNFPSIYAFFSNC